MAASSVPTGRPGRRMSAAARRQTILDAAIVEFARGGYWGTSTETIGHAAGVSQPYVMRIFGTKAELFRLAFDRALQVVTGEAAGDAPTAAPDLPEAYDRMVSHHDAMMVLLHGFAHGAVESDLHDQAREGMATLFGMVHTATAGDAEQAAAALSSSLLAHVLMNMEAVESAGQEPFRALTLAALEPPQGPDRATARR